MNKKKIVVYQPIGIENEEYYDAQIWVFSHNKWWYAGCGKYFRTLEDVLKYGKELELSIEFA